MIRLGNVKPRAEGDDVLVARADKVNGKFDRYNVSTTATLECERVVASESEKTTDTELYVNVKTEAVVDGDCAAVQMRE